MRSLAFSAILAAPLLSSAALACPTGADLATGISIRFDDGALETYTALRDDLVRIEQGYDGEASAVMDLALGVYLLSYMDVVNGSPDTGSRYTISYPGGIGGLQVPAPGQRWTAETVLMDSTGPYTETMTVAWSQPFEQIIGACSYEAIEALIAYQGDDFYTEGLVFLPDLGVAYVSAYEDTSGRSEYAAVEVFAAN